MTKIPDFSEVWFKPNDLRQQQQALNWLDTVRLLGFQTLFQPNKKAAPWHWQGLLPVSYGITDLKEQGVLRVNMWPHLGKWQIDGKTSQIGWVNMSMEVMHYQNWHENMEVEH